MKPLKLGVIAMCLASAAGCSATTSTAESDKPPANGGTYDTPEAIVETLDESDLECAGLSEMPGAEKPAMTQNCTGGGDNVIVRIFDNPAELETEQQAFEGAALFRGKTMLVGKNWNIIGATTFVEDAHDILGGYLVESG